MKMKQIIILIVAIAVTAIIVWHDLPITFHQYDFIILDQANIDELVKVKILKLHIYSILILFKINFNLSLRPSGHGG